MDCERNVYSGKCLVGECTLVFLPYISDLVPRSAETMRPHIEIRDVDEDRAGVGYSWYIEFSLRPRPADFSSLDGNRCKLINPSDVFVFLGFIASLMSLFS